MSGDGRIAASAYLEFFASGALPNDIPVPVKSTTDGLGIVERRPEPAVPSYRQNLGQEYALYYQQQEKKRQLKEASGTSIEMTGSVTASMSRLELDTCSMSLPARQPPLEQLTQVYEQYDFSHHDPQAAQLSVHKYREQIVRNVQANEVVIIEGHTGCGKTTQVPQYIMEDCRRLNQHVNIVVTQPRRIAAASVAQRVARERNWPIGSLVGYEIGLEKRVGPDTRLTYCTTGVLLQKLVHQRSLSPYTHVILDEVHERDTDTDFALLLVRMLQQSQSRDVKVILMSATFNVRQFADYFARPVQERFDPARIICVGRESFHQINEHFVEELMSLLPQSVQNQSTGSDQQFQHWDSYSMETPRIHPLLYKLVVELIKTMNRFEIHESQASERHPRFGRQRGSVLIFLPGMYEIQELMSELERDRVHEHWRLLPLHSLITNDEQSLVFQSVPADQRKIILSTNIAESSITVADVKYVIDFCLTKELEVDPTTNYPTLRLGWASRASCKQRAGRAGRVSSGRVYRLVSRQFYQQLAEYSVPEMLRCPLEHVVIKAKKFSFGMEPKEMLALALEPPVLQRIFTAVLHLKEVGALLDIEHDDRFNPYDGELTVLGHVMAALPVDVNLARLLALGHAYGCLPECITIAAGLTSKSIFARPFNDQVNSYHSKLAWAGGSFSDCLAILRVYTVWDSYTRQGHYQRSAGRTEQDWAAAQGIQLKCLKDMATLRRELESRLDRCNIRPPNRPGPTTASQQRLVLQVCIAGAFYPNYFTRLYQEEREQEAYRALAGHNLHTTVCITHLPQHCGLLYYGQILQQLRKINSGGPDPIIDFENTKAYVEFPSRRSGTSARSSWSGDIPTAVYLAVRLGQTRNSRLQIMRYSVEEETARMEEYRKLEARRRQQLQEPNDAAGGGNSSATGHHQLVSFVPSTRSCSRQSRCRLPGPGVVAVAVVVSHIEDPSHFYVRYSDPQSATDFELVFNCITRHQALCQPARALHQGARLQLGELYLAPYAEPGGDVCYYRGRLDSWRENDECLVYFIDYGNTEVCPRSALLDFCAEMKAEGVLGVNAMAVQCQLSEIKPPRIMNGRWSDDCVARLRKLALYESGIARIYSVLHGVIHMELLVNQRQGLAEVEKSVNQLLVQEGLAEEAVEGHYSRKDHEARIVSYSWNTSSPQWEQQEMTSDPTLTGWLFDLDQGSGLHSLRGPESPLGMTLTGVPRSLMSKPVVIDSDSVNAVLLDNEPHNPYQRLLVAAHVAPISDSSRVRASGTSLMPNMPGFTALMALIFAPTVELRVDTARGRITGAICGLGPVSDHPGRPDFGEPIYQDHDSEVAFDVAITTTDLHDINVLRAIFWLMYLVPGPNSQLAESDRSVLDNQRKLRERLLRLMRRRRESLLPTASMNAGGSSTAPQTRASVKYRWNQLPEDDVMEPRLDAALDLRLLPYLVRGSRSVQHTDTQDLKRRVTALFEQARTSDVVEQHHCPLCEVTTATPSELLRHIHSGEHERRLHQLYVQDEAGDELDEEDVGTHQRPTESDTVHGDW